jgi:succinate dehydrogenase/fumarate reductase flavoprotein subunit
LPVGEGRGPQPEVVETTAKVLVIGGGLAGAWAAFRASELTDGVVLIDKAFVSRSGASTMSGGVTTAPLRSDDLSEWVEELVRLGGYESNQDWTWRLLEGQIDRVETLDSWDVPIVKNEDGTIRRIASRGMINVRALQYSPKRAMKALRAHLIDNGVKILDKVSVAELITADLEYPTGAGGKVAGAIGIDVSTGVCHVIRSPAVVMSTGPLSMKGQRPVDNDSGDGTAMAFRSGCRFVNMEFSAEGTFEVIAKRFRLGNFNIAVGNGGRLINRLGERFMEQYDPVRFERTELSRVVAAFMKEILDGRGPVSIDLTQCNERYWEALRKVGSGSKGVLFPVEIPDPHHHPILVEPTWSFWNCGAGGIQVDTECRSSLDGLFAAGSVTYNGAVGRHGSAGSPTAYAMVSGYRAGEAAATHALDRTAAAPQLDDIRPVISDLYAPLGRAATLTPDELYMQILMAQGSPLELMIKTQERLEQSRDRVAELKGWLPSVGVDSTHELIKYHDARNTLDCLGLSFTCMLNRTESRGNFYREDYPYSDDAEWLCWHFAQQTADGIQLGKQAIPFEQYTFQPGEFKRTLSPLAAIFREEYDPSSYENLLGERSA